MSVNNMASCDPAHNADIAYICYGNKQAFCRACFKKHRDKCASSKCGDAHRLCYSILEKYEHCKLKMNLLAMDPTTKEYGQLKDSLASNFYNYSRLLEEHISRKVPYFVLQMQNKLVEGLLMRQNSSVSSTTEGQVKFEKIYNNMNTIIKKGRYTRDDLDFLISELNKAFQLQYSLKDASRKKSESNNSSTTSNRAKECLELAKSIKCELEYHLDVKDEIDSIIMNKMRSIISKLSKMDSITSYEALEGIPTGEPEPTIGQLEQSAQLMLENAKNILKRSLYEESSQILGYNGFPYKYCYIISTCPTPDINYEKLVLGLEKKLVETMLPDDATTKTLDHITKRIVIMGPQVIQVRFTFDKRLYFLKMNIFGYQEDRKPYYESILPILGVSKNKYIDKTSDSNRIAMDKVSQPMDMVYNNIEIAYSLIFRDNYVESHSQRIKMGRDFMIKECEKKERNKTLPMDEFKRREFEFAMIN